MHIGLLIFFIILVFVWAILRNTMTKKTNENDSAGDDQENSEENIDIEEIFFEEVRNGESAYKLLNISNQFDLMFIKSLFQFEQIPYRTESEFQSRLRPGMLVGGFAKTGVYILEKDYDDAVKVVARYIDNKKEGHLEKVPNRTPVEILVGGWTVPGADDIDGIDILYKSGQQDT